MPHQKLSRRTFLQSATAATLAAKLNPASAQPTAKTEIPYPENGTLIPDDDWRLWIDEKSEWKNDTYQAKGRQSNGLLIEKHSNSTDVEIIAAYSCDHDRNIGAGTFTAKLGTAKSSITAFPTYTQSSNSAFSPMPWPGSPANDS